MTDCATYLNGRGVGSRYDGSYSGSTRVGSCTGLTGSGATFSSSYKEFLRQTWEAQVSPFFFHAVLHHALTGGQGNNVREGEWVDHVDVEDGASGRVVISSWPEVWLDSEQPYLPPIPQYLRLSTKRTARSAPCSARYLVSVEVILC